MSVGSDNVFPKVILAEGAAPSSPPAGQFKLYVDSADHIFKYKNSAGTVTSLGTINDNLPWGIEINPLGAVATQTNWSTIVNSYTAGTIYTGWALETTGVQNAEVGWDVVLAAGTWTVQIFAHKQNNFGIVTVSIDGSSIGTHDLYNVASVGFLTVGVLSIAGVSVATLGKKRLLLKMATKNASSSNYYCDLAWVRLYRTA